MFRRVVPGVVLVLLLAGCTPVGQFLAGPGGAATPAPSASPSAGIPTPTPTPTPTSGDCDDVVLTDPGEYHLPDCLRVTVRGHDIQVNAGSVQTLVIDGNANDVDAGDVESASITGAVNHLDTLDLGALEIHGNFNTVGVHGSLERGAIDGDDNSVLADGEIGAVEDRGERNEIGSQP
jgi:hypothetical protein